MLVVLGGIALKSKHIVGFKNDGKEGTDVLMTKASGSYIVKCDLPFDKVLELVKKDAKDA